MQIYSHRIGTALDWLGTGLRLFAKQWAKFLSLFITLLFFFGLLVILPDFLLLIVSVLSIPVIQMFVFNAAHGTRIRGHFLLSDLIKKLDNPQVWIRLFIAALINTFAVYMIMQLTLPNVPISVEQLETMSSMELAQYVAQHMPATSFIPGVALVSMFMLFTAWVFPLISWESMGILQAYQHSFKATLQNVLPLVFLWALLICITLFLVLFPQYIALYFIQNLNVFYLLMFLGANTASVVLLICQYTTYIGLFFEPEKEVTE